MTSMTDGLKNVTLPLRGKAADSSSEDITAVTMHGPTRVQATVAAVIPLASVGCVGCVTTHGAADTCTDMPGRGLPSCKRTVMATKPASLPVASTADGMTLIVERLKLGGVKSIDVEHAAKAHSVRRMSAGPMDPRTVLRDFLALATGRVID